MTRNQDVQAAKRYHQGTKHPHGSLLDPGHRFLPRHRPLLFKKYRDLMAVELDAGGDVLEMPALEAISRRGESSLGANIPDLRDVAALLFFSAGITKRIHYRGVGEMFFRAASCTGALYHIELYLVCRDLPGLEAGVYHFDPAAMSLDILREGDFRQVLVSASGDHPAVAQAPAVFIYSDVPYRNACKYQSREYRHAFWDSGTILSHSLACASAEGLEHLLLMGFEDAAVNDLLGLKLEEEFALALLTLGRDLQGQPPPAAEMPPLDVETVPIIEEKKRFPAIQRMHRASILNTPKEVKKWREEGVDLQTSMPSEGKFIPLDPLQEEELPEDRLDEVIRRRGSSREFSRELLGFQAFSTLLVRSTRGIPADLLAPEGMSLNEIYLIVHAVETLDPGAYVYHPEEGVLELLERGNFREESRRMALGQDLGGDCAAAVYFLSDLEVVLDRLGNRGYRVAQVEASIVAGKMYLAAYAQSFGATGLTFLDDQVTSFFSPRAAGMEVMFLIAVGIPG